MQILQTFSIVFSIIICLVLVFLILIQSGKSGGLGIFGGGGSSTPFGVSTVDVVTKLTWWLVGLFFVVAILTAIAFAEGGPRVEAPTILNPATPRDANNGNTEKSGSTNGSNTEKSDGSDGDNTKAKNDNKNSKSRGGNSNKKIE